MKARWSIRGYLDPDVLAVPKQSPTLSAEGFAHTLQIIASNKWVMQVANVEGAFLQGEELKREHGDLYVEQPPGGIPGMQNSDLIAYMDWQTHHAHGNEDIQPNRAATKSTGSMSILYVSCEGTTEGHRDSCRRLCNGRHRTFQSTDPETIEGQVPIQDMAGAKGGVYRQNPNSTRQL